MQLVTRLAMKDKEKLKQGEDSMDSKTEAEILKILFDAVLHMGYRAILSLVSALSVGQILSSEFRGYGYGKRELWLHSVTTALATQPFARSFRLNRAMHDPSLGFIAGVMHDIGKAGLNTDLGQDPQTVSSEMEKLRHLAQTGEKPVRYRPRRLGSHLVKQWKLLRKSMMQFVITTIRKLLIKWQPSFM